MSKFERERRRRPWDEEPEPPRNPWDEMPNDPREAWDEKAPRPWGPGGARGLGLLRGLGRRSSAGRARHRR